MRLALFSSQPHRAADPGVYEVNRLRAILLVYDFAIKRDHNINLRMLRSRDHPYSRRIGPIELLRTICACRAHEKGRGLENPRPLMLEY